MTALRLNHPSPAIPRSARPDPEPGGDSLSPARHACPARGNVRADVTPDHLNLGADPSAVLHGALVPAPTRNRSAPSRSSRLDCDWRPTEPNWLTGIAGAELMSLRWGPSPLAKLPRTLGGQ